MKYDLDAVLGPVRDEFVSASAWTDPKVQPKVHLRRDRSGRVLPTGEKRQMPADAFSVSLRLPDDPASAEAKARYYVVAGMALAFNARRNGATSPDEFVLSVALGAAVGADQYVTVTATPKPQEVRN